MGEPNSNTANLQDEIFRAAKVGDKELLQSLLNKGQVDTCFHVISDVMDFLYTEVLINKENPLVLT